MLFHKFLSVSVALWNLSEIWQAKSSRIKPGLHSGLHGFYFKCSQMHILRIFRGCYINGAYRYSLPTYFAQIIFVKHFAFYSLNSANTGNNWAFKYVTCFEVICKRKITLRHQSGSQNVFINSKWSMWYFLSLHRLRRTSHHLRRRDLLLFGQDAQPQPD